ncbi:MAG: macro domain-containing protein [candidate division Zixibacteria bacterium]|nr:macro domain-containing protein [candidate division Zixibacteria bacterium]
MPIAIEIKQGSLLSASTQAIVNAANNKFWMGSGVAGAIKAAGGDSIETEAMAKGQVMPGEAIYTSAGKLPFKYIIHAATMGQDLRTNDKLIRQATVASLVLAEKLKVESIAFPAFGTGVGGFPIRASANIMIKAAHGFEGLAQSVKAIQFWLLDDVMYKIFLDASKRLSEE